MEDPDSRRAGLCPAAIGRQPTQRPAPMPNTCIACAIASGQSPAHIIHQNDRIICFLDHAPINPGHILICPRAHLADLTDLLKTCSPTSPKQQGTWHNCSRTSWAAMAYPFCRIVARSMTWATSTCTSFRAMSVMALGGCRITPVTMLPTRSRASGLSWLPTVTGMARHYALTRRCKAVSGKRDEDHAMPCNSRSQRLSGSA